MDACVFVDHIEPATDHRYHCIYKPALENSGFRVRLIQTPSNLEHEFLHDQKFAKTDIYLTEIDSNRTSRSASYLRPAYTSGKRLIVIYLDTDKEASLPSIDNVDEVPSISIDRMTIYFYSDTTTESFRLALFDKIQALASSIVADDRALLKEVDESIDSLSEIGLIEKIVGPNGETYARMNPNAKLQVTNLIAHIRTPID